LTYWPFLAVSNIIFSWSWMVYSIEFTFILCFAAKGMVPLPCQGGIK
jgi:hypothetical protein